LSLSDALDLGEIASSGAWWVNQSSGTPFTLGYILGVHEHNAADYEFDSFDCHSEDFLNIELDLSEWISLSRWSSELSELRHLDYKRAAKSTLTPGQLAAPWV
jgi:hypothetical protein